MTFKQYITRLPDDLSPEEAQERYRQYLVEHHGSVIKAEFATTKDQTKVKALYDPRSVPPHICPQQQDTDCQLTRSLHHSAFGHSSLHMLRRPGMSYCVCVCVCRRSFEKALAKRNEEAAESRSKFFDDLNAGALEPTAAGFNQGAGSLAPKATSENGTAGASGDASTAKGEYKRHTSTYRNTHTQLQTSTGALKGCQHSQR